MRPSIRFKLHGTYETPRYRIGQRVKCEIRGEVTIVGLSAGRIPWPVTSTPGGRPLIIYKGLARALREESVQAVAYHWGRTRETISVWRKQLGIAHVQTPGTSKLRSAFFQTPNGRRLQRLAWEKAGDPERRRKIGASRVGIPRSPETIAKMRKAAAGKKATPEARLKMSLARGGRPWESWEDELVRAQSPRTIKAKTGRSNWMIWKRRHELGLPGLGEGKCEGCGTKIVGRRDKRFCSHRCWQRAVAKRRGA